MAMIRVWGIGALVALAMAGCALAPRALITYEKHGLPGAPDSRLAIAADGTWTYREAGDPPAKRTGVLDRARMEKLVDAFNASGYRQLSSEYKCGGGDGHDHDDGCGGHSPHASIGGCTGCDKDKDAAWMELSYEGKRVRVFGCSPTLLLPMRNMLEATPGGW